MNAPTNSDNETHDDSASIHTSTSIRTSTETSIDDQPQQHRKSVATLLKQIQGMETRRLGLFNDG